MNMLHGPLAQARQAEFLREAQHARLVRLARQNRAIPRMPVRHRRWQLFAGRVFRRPGAMRDPARCLPLDDHDRRSKPRLLADIVDPPPRPERGTHVGGAQTEHRTSGHA
jgi:hypothetical protein